MERLGLRSPQRAMMDSTFLHGFHDWIYFLCWKVSSPGPRSIGCATSCTFGLADLEVLFIIVDRRIET
jgi:hypothetical protein